MDSQRLASRIRFLPARRAQECGRNRARDGQHRTNGPPALQGACHRERRRGLVCHHAGWTGQRLSIERSCIMNITPETLAGIAVHLLQGKDYNDAVRRAYGLLRAAEKEIQWQEEIAAQPATDAPAHLDYKAGIRFITGQARGDRAERYFTELMDRSLQQTKQIDVQLRTGKWPDAKGVPKTSKQELCDAI